MLEAEVLVGPGVFAEIDPDTFEVRAFSSTNNLAETLREKRLHSDGVFHVIWSLNDTFEYAKEQSSPDFEDTFQQLCGSILSHAPIGREPTAETIELAVVRALEGAIAKTKVGSRIENANRLKELFSS